MPIYVTDARPMHELVDIRELVQPHTFLIQRRIRALEARGDDAISQSWAATVCQIRYPPEHPVDWHRVEAYQQKDNSLFAGSGNKPVFSIESEEVLETPAETLTLGMADCDGQSILACSVLRNFLGPNEVYVSFGTWNGYGHAWVTLIRNGEAIVLETTKQHKACDLAFRGLKEGDGYIPMFRFNDVQADDLVGFTEGDDEVRYMPLDKIGLHVANSAKLDCLCRSSVSTL